jgi:hypothetical protein
MDVCPLCVILSDSCDGPIRRPRSILQNVSVSFSESEQKLDQASSFPACSCTRIFTRVLVRGLLVALIMEAVRSFETWASFYKTTRRSIHEDIFKFTAVKSSKSVITFNPLKPKLV